MLNNILALQLYLHSSKIYENCVRHFPLNSYTWNWLNNEIGFLIMYASNVRFPLSQADLIFDMNYLPWQKSISILRLSYVQRMVTNKSILGTFLQTFQFQAPFFALIKLARAELTNGLDCSINWIIEANWEIWLNTLL